jgi:hypothetical protein
MIASPRRHILHGQTSRTVGRRRQRSAAPPRDPPLPCLRLAGHCDRKRCGTGLPTMSRADRCCGATIGTRKEPACGGAWPSRRRARWTCTRRSLVRQTTSRNSPQCGPCAMAQAALAEDHPSLPDPRLISAKYASAAACHESPGYDSVSLFLLPCLVDDER